MNQNNLGITLFYCTLVGLFLAIIVSSFFPLERIDPKALLILSSGGAELYKPLVRQKVFYFLTLAFVVAFQFIGKYVLAQKIQRTMPLLIASSVALFSLYESARELFSNTILGSVSIFNFLILSGAGFAAIFPLNRNSRVAAQ